jgi:hypothetical protein
MCFLLYAGTVNPISRRSWDREAPDISVQSLGESEQDIRAHFDRPEVQKIGSTSCCGCDFPWVMFQNGGWPTIGDSGEDEDQSASDLFNREALVGLLRTIEEDSIELYGVWAGDYAKMPQCRERISLEAILDPDFRFKERGYYEVRL